MSKPPTEIKSKLAGSEISNGVKHIKAVPQPPRPRCDKPELLKKTVTTYTVSGKSSGQVSVSEKFRRTPHLDKDRGDKVRGKEKNREKKARDKRNRKLFISVAAVFTIAVLTLTALGFNFWTLSIKPPQFKNLMDYSKYTKAEAINYQWKSSGASAIGTVEYGVKAARGDSKLLPIASIAKVITALVVLEKTPISEGADGPTITIDQEDVNLLAAETARNGTTMPVYLGEKLTLKQALTGMMLLSGNNMANSLAIKSFGSLEAYKTAAEGYLKRNDCPQTQIGDDASGLDPKTASTASELVKIGILAEKNPTLAGIVAQKSASLPGINGQATNTNELLKVQGFVGIKTGTTPSAGACLLSAFKHTVNGETVTIVVAILGDTADKRFQDAADASHFLASKLKADQIIKRGELIGEFDFATGKREFMTADRDVEVVHFQDQPINIELVKSANPSDKTARIRNKDSGEFIGTASAPDRLSNHPEICAQAGNLFEHLKQAVFLPQCG